MKKATFLEQWQCEYESDLAILGKTPTSQVNIGELARFGILREVSVQNNGGTNQDEAISPKASPIRNKLFMSQGFFPTEVQLGMDHLLENLQLSSWVPPYTSQGTKVSAWAQGKENPVYFLHRRPTLPTLERREKMHKKIYILKTIHVHPQV